MKNQHTSMMRNTRRKNAVKKMMITVAVALLSLSAAAAILMFGIPKTVSYLPDPQSVATPEIAPVVQDLSGQWIAEGENGGSLSAVIQDGNIEITLVNNDVSLLYWVGTFNPRSNDGDKVVSTKVDVPKAVLSRATSKDFVIGINIISFDLTAMGRTTNIHLHRM